MFTCTLIFLSNLKSDFLSVLNLYTPYYNLTKMPNGLWRSELHYREIFQLVDV